MSDRHASLVTPVGDVAALAAAIRRLADARLRREMGRRGRQLAEERFNPEAVGRQLLELYREVLAPPGSKAGP